MGIPDPIPSWPNVPPEETVPTQFSHINGTTEELLARFAISEIAKGWPVYRDASEWNNYRSLFTDDASVFTTWSGGLKIDDFIAISKKGRSNGDFIMHRENGTLSEVNLSAGRGIGKMKATITQRFNFENTEIDVECDCRFIFFCQKQGNEWKTRWVKLFYEKDKIVAVDGKNAPTFPPEELAKYPEGYKYLAVAQNKIGHPILNGLPTTNNKAFYQMYEAMDLWLKGETIDLYWKH